MMGRSGRGFLIQAEVHESPPAPQRARLIHLEGVEMAVLSVCLFGMLRDLETQSGLGETSPSVPFGYMIVGHLGFCPEMLVRRRICTPSQSWPGRLSLIARSVSCSFLSHYDTRLHLVRIVLWR